MKKAVLFSTALAVLVMLLCAITAHGQEKDPPLFPIEQDGLWGYIDRKGKVVIKQQYYHATNFQEGLASVFLSNIKTAYIDKTGKKVIMPDVLDVNSFREGLARFRLLFRGNLAHGYLDKTGKKVIVARYSDARDFSEGMAAVEIKKKDRRGLNVPVTRWGFIDKQGKKVIDFQFWNARSFSNGLAAVRVPNTGWGFIDKKGKFIITPAFEGAWDFSESLALVNVGGKNPEPIEDVGCFPWRKHKRGSETPGNKDKGKFGFIDKTGKIIIAAKYAAAASFSEGMALVEINGKYGYIDKTGKLVIEANFDEALCFHEGMAAVRKGNKWGYIDKTAKAVIKPNYDDAWSFGNGLAAVRENGKMAYIDKTGKSIWKAPDKPDPELAEAGAVKILRDVSAAQVIYSTRYVEFGSLEDLIKKVKLDKELASGKKNGYIFELKAEKDSWSCVARPEKPGETGTRSFYLDETGVIRCRQCRS